MADEERVTQDVVMQREVITDIGLRRPVVSWIGHQATLKKICKLIKLKISKFDKNIDFLNYKFSINEGLG